MAIRLMSSSYRSCRPTTWPSFAARRSAPWPAGSCGTGSEFLKRKGCSASRWSWSPAAATSTSSEPWDEIAAASPAAPREESRYRSIARRVPTGCRPEFSRAYIPTTGPAGGATGAGGPAKGRALAMPRSPEECTLHNWAERLRTRTRSTRVKELRSYSAPIIRQEEEQCPRSAAQCLTPASP